MSRNDFKPETRSLLRALRRAGFTLASVNNGDCWVTVTSESQALAELTASDSAGLIVLYGVSRQCRLMLVYGNSPGELVADYTDWITLSEVVDAESKKWSGRKQPTIA